MSLRSHVPPPPLSDFVHMFWYQEAYSAPHAHERCLPTGAVDLVIDLDEDTIRLFDGPEADRYETFRDAVICGPHAAPFVIEASHRTTTVGIAFNPGGARPFLGLPADELQDRHVALETLWGAAAGELRERLLEADDVAARFRILEQTLLAQARGDLVRHPAVRHALHELEQMPRGRTVADLVDETGLCQRRFIQIFSDQVGLTPKVYSRVRRFQDVLRRIDGHERVDWAALALDCGYYDQAHFIRDFRAFSGLSPTAYLAQRSEHLNHVPLPG